MKSINKFITNVTSGVAGGGGLTGQSFTINGHNIIVGDKIADGGYGIIYSCTDSSGKKYALKALQAPDQEHYDAIIQEFQIHKKCANHPNIVQVFGMSSNQSTRQALILMEFCTDDLIKHINAVFHQGFDDQTIVEIFTSICEAVNHVHSQNPPIIHRDLKPENVLRNDGKWKLCDFGSAITRVYTLETNSERNEASDDLEKNTTALYRAPEMCDLYRRQKIDTKADVWALGCILYKLCTFKDAFGEGNNLQILNMKYSWPPNKKVNQKFKDIVTYIFNTDPSERPTARDVLGELQRQFPNWVNQKWQQSKIQSHSPSSQNNQQNQPQQQQSQQTFNPFNQQNSGPSLQPQQQFSLFDRQNQPQQSFNPFQQQQQPQQQANPFQSGNNSNTYDPFAQLQQKAPSIPNDPFAQAGPPTPIAPQNDPFNQPNLPPPKLNQPPQQNGGTFDPFEMAVRQAQQNQTSTQQQQSKSPQSSTTSTLVTVNHSNQPQQPVSNHTEFDELGSKNRFDPHRAENDMDNFIKDCLTLQTEFEMNSVFFGVSANYPASPFFIKLMHQSGTKISRVILSLPDVGGPLGGVLKSRKSFHSRFPQFEGNFALTSFLREHKANPVPIGQPPICADAVKELLTHLDKALSYLRSSPIQAAGEEAFVVYQTTAFILARLKQSKINEGYTVNTAIPLFKNFHTSLKKAFSFVKPPMKFHEEPFDFNDEKFLKAIRPPASIGV